MPSRRSPALVGLLLLGLAVPSLAADATAEATAAAAPTVRQVQDAAEAVRADPNLGTERMVRTLRFRDGDEPEDNTQPSWLEWFERLFNWIGQSARLLVWVLCAVLACVVAIYLLRLWRGREASVAVPKITTHVRDLDIRPESLPEDVGAAARALWDAGQLRAALALLYRGLLSRLAHAYQAPLRDSTTEGDTIALARGHLPAASHEFAFELVRTWTRAVYGEDMPYTERVHGLCAGFATALDARTSKPAGSA